MKRAAVVSTFPGVEEVGAEVFAKGGSALKAAVSMFFAAAGTEPGVLMSPVSVLVAGLGLGARAYDGRARQPGLEGKRPRGLLADDEIPLASRVAIPGSIGALAVACAYDTGTTLLSCSRPGVAAAKRVGQPERAAFIDMVAGLGASAFTYPAIKRAFLGRFGPAEGGVLTATDLEAPEAIDGPALGDDDAFRVPQGDEAAEEDAPLGQGHIILALDVSGQHVALAFRQLDARAILEPFAVSLPLLGAPVFRGKTRLAPGTRLPTPVHIEIRRDAAGNPNSVFGRPRKDAPELAILRDSVSKVVTVLR